MFPHADIFVKYMDDYTKKLGLKVQYNTDIRSIRREGIDTKEPVYRLQDNNDNQFTCS